jgi:acetyl/propionyl-CoA carboxylase alpha subunit
MADEAYAIGPAPSRESYLVIEKIIDAAQRQKPTPSPGLRISCGECGIRRSLQCSGRHVHGPSPASIALMGSKIQARAP